MKLIKDKILIVTTSFFVLLCGDLVYGRAQSKWDNSLEHRVVRCFKMENVKVRCDSYVIPDTDGKISAELEILAADINDKKFVYGYGKSIEGPLCWEHLSKIQKLTRNQGQVCITGDGEHELNSGEIFVRWRELESRLGKVVW